MISTFTSARATRWAGGVLVVAASALSTGIIGPIASASAAAPALITISPASSTIAQGGCAAFTVHATPVLAGQPITVQATQNNVAATPLSTCTPAGGGTTLTPLSNGVSGGSAGFPPIIPATNGNATMRFYGNTDANGFITFGISSTLVGSVSVVAYYNSTNGTTGVNAAPVAANTQSSASTVNVIAGGAAAVGHLTVSPTTATQYVGGGVAFTVKTTDTNNVAIPGIEVDFVMSGVDTQVPLHQCGVKTASDGTATCTITNGGTAGTDNLTFYVNAAGGSPGPDSGEPQVNSSVVFQPLPGGGSFVINGTCSNTRIGGPSPIPAGQACTNSTATHNVTFTATVTNASTSAPVSGVSVTWSHQGSAGTTTLSSPNCTTGSDGSCSIVLTEPSPAHGELHSLIASVGPSTSSPITAGWGNPVPTSISVRPTLQTVTNGGSPAFRAHVLDQFGADVSPGHNIKLLVTAGRNAGKTVNGVTQSNGVPLSYTDTNLNPASTTDTVQFTDQGPSAVSGAVNATVNYIAGSAQAGLIALDLSGTCNTAAPSSTNSSAVGANSIKVCALVTNGSGTKLLGKAVTFAVSTGRVDPTSTPASGSSPSITVDTDSNGVATAWVSSNTAATQTVTATADSVTASGTVSYSTSVANLKTVKISPVTTEVEPGSNQTFTATAQDASGNPVAGASLLFVVSGPGSIGGGSNQLLITAGNGTASVVLNTASTDSGTGTVTVSVQNDAATQCHATGGACSAVSTYTVKTGAKQASLLLFPQKNVTAGSDSAEGVEAVAVNSDGTVAPNVLVRFTVTGANSAIGSATTASSGAAIFAYDAINAGTDTIVAYEDLNNNNVKDAGEPGATTTATIHPAGSHPGVDKEKPTLVVTQKHANSHQEKLTLHVTSHPKLAGAPVTFYQVKKGVRHKIGVDKTSKHGTRIGTLRAAHGLTLKFQVKVGPKAGVKSGYSKVVTVHVK